MCRQFCNIGICGKQIGSVFFSNILIEANSRKTDFMEGMKMDSDESWEKLPL